jgi:hypothetical protein
MKTAYLSLALVFLLNITTLYAGDPMASVKTENKKTVIIVESTVLAPATPKEAGFSELTPDVKAVVPVINPVTPREAKFEEDTTECNILFLAPVTPKEADFSEN